MFDIQVERTENFIANGLVSHNTRWNLDDPAGRFLINMANGTGDRWEIVCLPSLYRGFKTHPEDPRTEVDEALWPRHRDTESLRRLRELNPRAFSALHQQDPSAAGSEWPPEWFGEDVWFDQWPDRSEGDRVLALDTSKGVGGKTGDYSSFAKVHRHQRTFYCEFDMSNTRNKLDMQRDAIRIIKEFRPRIFGIEEAQGGDAFAEKIRAACRAEGIDVVIVTINNMRPNEQGNLENTPKEQRIRFLTDFFGGRYFRFKKNSSGTTLCVQQLMEFPNGEHDDGPDSAEMAIQLFKGW